MKLHGRGVGEGEEEEEEVVVVRKSVEVKGR